MKCSIERLLRCTQTGQGSQIFKPSDVGFRITYQNARDAHAVAQTPRYIGSHLISTLEFRKERVRLCTSLFLRLLTAHQTNAYVAL